MPRKSKSASRKLRRRTASRSPKKIITVFSEGRLTEIQYFTALANLNRDKTIVNCVGGVGVPMTVVDKAVDFAKKHRHGRRSSFEKRDEIWAVFDCDEHPNVNEAIQRAASSIIYLVYSNPCFEIWLYLHFADCHAPQSRHEIQRRLENIGVGYARDNKTVDIERFKDLIELAEERAVNCCRCREEEGKPNGNPSTTAFELSRSIRGE